MAGFLRFSTNYSTAHICEPLNLDYNLNMEKIYKTEDEWKKILGPFQASPGLGSQENLSSVPEVLSYSSTMIENRQGGRLTRVASSFRITLTNRVRS